ncbi:MAG: hypothetical protein QOE75_367 [Solirubrobacterales bacterium]|nr:hypothetical protein [Solirubrobacterales bacterium]
MLWLGIVAAVGASCLYNTSIALQALQVRDVHHEHSLKPSLLGKMLQNKRWLGATALGLIGWPLEIVALLFAPLTVVQPCLASGLIVLLWLGVRKLGETPGKREYLSVAAITAGVIGVAWAAPERTTEHAATWAIALSLGIVAIPIVLPYLLRGRAVAAGMIAVVSAGCGYAWTAIASKLLTDELSEGALLIAVAWLATAILSEALALLSEMSALQKRPATHVAPVMFAFQVLVPVVLAPLIFMEKWSGTPLDGGALVFFMLVALTGVILLAGSKTVGAVLESAHREPS